MNSLLGLRIPLASLALVCIVVVQPPPLSLPAQAISVTDLTPRLAALIKARGLRPRTPGPSFSRTTGNSHSLERGFSPTPADPAFSSDPLMDPQPGTHTESPSLPMDGDPPLRRHATFRADHRPVFPSFSVASLKGRLRSFTITHGHRPTPTARTALKPRVADHRFAAHSHCPTRNHRFCRLITPVRRSCPATPRCGGGGSSPPAPFEPAQGQFSGPRLPHLPPSAVFSWPVETGLPPPPHGGPSRKAPPRVPCPRHGFVNLISLHTTTAVTINEHEECLMEDLKEWLLRLAPPDQAPPRGSCTHGHVLHGKHSM